MYPHERSLVERMSDRPFALVGVNSDRDRAGTLAVTQAQDLTWRSFWDGGGTSGPIASAWRVHSWPTIYVIDHKGVIRFVNVRGPDLDAAVEKLVTEAEADPLASRGR